MLLPSHSDRMLLLMLCTIAKSRESTQHWHLQCYGYQAHQSQALCFSKLLGKMWRCFATAAKNKCNGREVFWDIKLLPPSSFRCSYFHLLVLCLICTRSVPTAKVLNQVLLLIKLCASLLLLKLLLYHYSKVPATCILTKKVR